MGRPLGIVAGMMKIGVCRHGTLKSTYFFFFHNVVGDLGGNCSEM
jgi:hypothetical protein